MTDETMALEKTETDEINREHEACEVAANQAVHHALRCGALLNEAKPKVGHGNWGEWLGTHFAGSTRVAQTYMRLARHPNAHELAHLGVEEALKQIATPRQVERETVPAAEEVDPLLMGISALDEALRGCAVTSEDALEERRALCRAAKVLPFFESMPEGHTFPYVWVGYWWSHPGEGVAGGEVVGDPGWARYCVALLGDRAERITRDLALDPRLDPDGQMADALARMAP